MWTYAVSFFLLVEITDNQSHSWFMDIDNILIGSQSIFPCCVSNARNCVLLQQNLWWKFVICCRLKGHAGLWADGGYALNAVSWIIALVYVTYIIPIINSKKFKDWILNYSWYTVIIYDVGKCTLSAVERYIHNCSFNHWYGSMSYIII